MRADNGKQVGEAGSLQAEIGARPVGPLVLERLAAQPADIDLIEGPSDCIEARGIHDNIAGIYSASLVLTPLGVMREIGVSLRSTRTTLSRLYAS